MGAQWRRSHPPFDFDLSSRLWRQNTPPTEAPVQPDKQLADAEGDGGVGWDDDGLVSTFGVPAVVDLKLQRNRELSDSVNPPVYIKRSK